MPGHFGRGGKVLNRVINRLLLAFVDQRRSRSICLGPSSKFCRRWSGFRPTAFLSRTVVQGSVPHAVLLSPCQRTDIHVARRKWSVSRERRQMVVWRSPTMGQLRAGATRSFAKHAAHFLDSDGPAGDVSKTHHRNPRWSSQHGCCRQAP